MANPATDDGWITPPAEAASGDGWITPADSGGAVQEPAVKSLAKGAASLADTLYGIVPGMLGVGTYAASRAIGNTPEAADTAQTAVSSALDKPFGKAFGITDEPAYKGEASNRIMQFIGENISKGSKWVAEQTGLPEKDVENIANSLTIGVPVVAGKVLGPIARPLARAHDATLGAGRGEAAPEVAARPGEPAAAAAPPPRPARAFPVQREPKPAPKPLAAAKPKPAQEVAPAPEPFPASEYGNLDEVFQTQAADPAPAPRVERTGVLPKDLAGARPSYYYGDKAFNVAFESDIDKAAYITAQGKRSKRDTKYLEFVMRETGLTEAEVRAHGQAVKDYIKSLAKAEENGGDLSIPKQEILRPDAPAPRGLQALTPEEMDVQAAKAADTMAARRDAIARGIDPDAPKVEDAAKPPAEPKSIIRAILENGGIKRDVMEDVTGETRTGKGVKGLPPTLFKAKGLGIDDMATILRDRGFLIEEDATDGGVQQLKNMIRDEVDGVQKHYSAFDEQAVLDRMNWEKAEEARAQGWLDELHPNELMGENEALTRFGPGTLGSNLFLDPKAIKQQAAHAGRVARGVFRDVMGEHSSDRAAFRELRDSYKTSVKRLQRWVTGEASDVRSAFKTKAEREDLTQRIINNDMSGLPTEKAAVAAKVQQDYAELLQYARDSGVQIGERKNYSPDIWDLGDKKTKDLLDSWRAMRGEPAIDPGFSGEPGGGNVSPHMLSRTLTLDEGMKMGMKPLTLDAAELLETYVNSMAVAVEKSRIYDALPNLKTESGDQVMMPKGHAPKNYVSVRNPEFEGFRFHPDVAPDIRVLLETKSPGEIRQILQGIAYASKRALVSYSLFHPMAMFEAWVGTNPGLKVFNPKAAIDSALSQYRNGGIGDTVDRLLSNGLELTAPIEDAFGREKFKAWLDKASNIADKIIPGHAALGDLGLFPKLKQFDAALQRFTWPYLQTGFKLEIAARKYEQLTVKFADKIASGEMTEDQIASQVAKYTNAVEGGLDWEGMLDSFDTPKARKIMSEVLSQQGRRNMQLGMFAPDWMISTVASWTAALPSSEAAAVKAYLSRRYLAHSLMVTYAIGSAFNYYFTGHSMFENEPRKDNTTWQERLKAKTMVDLGDGRYINPNKHLMEVPHAATGLTQFVYNKMSPLLREPAEQTLNKQWLSPKWTPPITEENDSALKATMKRTQHAARKFLPIGGRGIMDAGPAGLGGLVGFPITGMTEDQKDEESEKRKIDRESIE